MFDFIDYIRRWLSTKAMNLVSNTAMALLIFLITCIAVKKNVFVTFSATKACLFSVLMCGIWSGLFNSIALFYSERDYMLDDLSKFLRVRTYISANVFIQTILCSMEAVVASVVFGLIFDYSNKGVVFTNRTLEYLVTFFLIMFSADMLGLLVGMMINSITSIMTVIPIVLIMQLLLSGCLFDLDGIMDSVAIVTTARWGFYALGSISDLNNMLQEGMHMNEFISQASHIRDCWIMMLILSAVCIAFAGVFLYTKVNTVES